MASLPKWLTVGWDTRPTAMDKLGCDGVYLRSVNVAWWGWPILLFESVIRQVRALWES
jgi:hypothetical protein